MKTSVFLLAILVVGCSSTPQGAREIEAVRDFVAAAQLEEVSEIRLRQQMSYTFLNVRFVTLPTRRGDYLIEFQRDCRALTSTEVTPDMVDIRANRNVLHAKFDTIRGCRISRIFELTDAQSAELEVLGDAPGDEIYLPGKQ